MTATIHGLRCAVDITRSDRCARPIAASLLLLLATLSSARQAAAEGLQTEAAGPRAVLYEEDPTDAKGKQFPGSVTWRTVPVEAAGDQKANIAIRGEIDIPDHRLKAIILLKRNTDPSLSASHTVELTFAVPADFAGRGISNVPGMLMKMNERARGMPLAALAVKVTDGVFLVGLSGVDKDRLQNIQLLRERGWIDIPIVYANQRRAILAIEKGTSGDQAFGNAFAAWGEAAARDPGAANSAAQH
jgi:hypothetical protein